MFNGTFDQTMSYHAYEKQQIQNHV